ncbi:MAG: AMP-binding protein [Actinomycetota bacterium]
MSGIGGWARTTPDAPALVCNDRTHRFAELEDLQARLASWLRSAGLTSGDRAGVLADNSTELLTVTIGCLRAGIVPVPISPLLTPTERHHLLEDSGARVLFADRRHECSAPLERVVRFEDLTDRLGDHQPAELAGVALTRPLHYTSGTTGRPKGVWLPPAGEREAARRSQSFRRQWGITASDVHLVCSPLTHSAPHRYALRTLEAGGCVVVQPRFEARATLEAVERHRATTTFMVPTHLERILALPEDELRRYDLSSLRVVAHAGAPIRRVTKERAMELFPPDSVWEFYGSTEGGFTRLSPAEAGDHPGSVGRPEGAARIEIKSPDDGRILGTGEVGVVWLRDPGAERFEYWGDEARTAEAWDHDAFTVGDLGYLDAEGYLYLTGRTGDLIISGGVNVYPREVEATLMAHPEVLEALVYGVHDPEWGQQVRAMIVPVPGASPDPEGLRAWTRSRIARHKCPRVIAVVDQLDRTATGKLKRIPSNAG